nr:glycosyltransferase [Lachnospiraceae bacterium]
VSRQTYDNWELILADASKTDAVQTALDAFEFPGNTIDKVKYFRLEENGGISANTNAAIEKAEGDYIALLDHDDLLSSDALFQQVVTINEYLEAHGREALSEILAVYSDEDKCDKDAKRFFETHVKPEFDPYLLETNNYICHFLMVRASLLKELKLRPAFDGAQDFDLILRIADKEGVVLHTPLVIYHWRVHATSTAGNRDSKLYAYEAGRKAILEHFERIGLSDHVTVKDSRHLGFYDIEYDTDVLTLRSELHGVCGKLVAQGKIEMAPIFDTMPDVIGADAQDSGYMHRLHLSMRAFVHRTQVSAGVPLRLRDGLVVADGEKEGMDPAELVLLYDPNFTEVK